MIVTPLPSNACATLSRTLAPESTITSTSCGDFVCLRALSTARVNSDIRRPSVGITTETSEVDLPTSVLEISIFDTAVSMPLPTQRILARFHTLVSRSQTHLYLYPKPRWPLTDPAAPFF